MTDENFRLGAIMDTKMQQCECGAYRFVDNNGEDAVGCRACITIERLNVLLEAGVRVIRSSKITMDPERLKCQRDRAEQEIENLKKEVSRLTEERNKSVIEEKRARYSAKVAQAASERVREGCHLAKAAGPDWN